MAYITVAKVADILPGQTCLVQVEQCPILVINDGGTFFALTGLCGHQHLSLAGAQVWQGVLDCPWHHFQYDIRTGENLYPRRVYPLESLPYLREQILPLQTYPVRILDQAIQVEIPTRCEVIWTAKNS
jgi:3-phenylpropionate/trans-cinnamate dioxygenase ferredoxin component